MRTVPYIRRPRGIGLVHQEAASRRRGKLFQVQKSEEVDGPEGAVPRRRPTNPGAHTQVGPEQLGEPHRNCGFALATGQGKCRRGNRNVFEGNQLRGRVGGRGSSHRAGSFEFREEQPIRYRRPWCLAYWAIPRQSRVRTSLERCRRSIEARPSSRTWWRMTSNGVNSNSWAL